MNKNPWLENSTNNIIPLSKSDDFKNSLKEWEFTGNVIDHEEPTEICELCEHEKLRYHYEIENIHNENYLWVGSSCILRFDDIIICDCEGIQLTNKTERKKELGKSLKKKQIDLILESLRELWHNDKEYRNYIEKNVEHLEEKNAFLPKGLAIMCARMKTYKVEFKYSMFPVYLRTDESKDQLYDLEPNLLQYVIKCMSLEQKRNFIDI